MPRKIRNLAQYTCKRCHCSYWSIDEKSAWCDACRAVNRAARAEKKRRKAVMAGQLSLELT